MRRAAGFLLEYGWIVFTAVLAAVAVAIATAWTVPVPNHELLDLAWQLHAWKLHGLGSLVARVNDHVIAFPMLLIVLPYAVFGVLPPLTGANLVYVNTFTALFSAAGFAAVLCVGRHVLRGATPARRCAVLCTAAAVGLSASQWELWTTSSIAYTLCTASALAAIALVSLRPGSRWSLPLAAGLCTVSMFSFAGGVFAWPAVLTCLVAARGKLSRRRAALWLMLGGCATACFLVFWVPTAHDHVPLLQVFKNTMRLIALPVFVASGPHPVYGAATLIGAVICAAFAICVRALAGHARADAAGLAGLFVFGALNAGVIATARHDILFSRYIALTYPALVALLFALGACLPRRSPALRGFLAATLLAVAALCLQSVSKIDGRYRHFARGAACLQTYDVSSDRCLGFIYFEHGAPVRSLAAMLESDGFLDRFAPAGASWEAWPHPNAGYLEWVTRSGSLLDAWGWADVRGCPARHVVLTSGESRRILSHTVSLLPRPEVGTVAGCGGHHGWTADLPAEAAGTGVLRAWAYDEDRNAFMLLGGITWKNALR